MIQIVQPQSLLFIAFLFISIFTSNAETTTQEFAPIATDAVNFDVQYIATSYSTVVVAANGCTTTPVVVIALVTSTTYQGQWASFTSTTTVGVGEVAGETYNEACGCTVTTYSGGWVNTYVSETSVVVTADATTWGYYWNDATTTTSSTTQQWQTVPTTTSTSQEWIATTTNVAPSTITTVTCERCHDQETSVSTISVVTETSSTAVETGKTTSTSTHTAGTISTTGSEDTTTVIVSVVTNTEGSPISTLQSVTLTGEAVTTTLLFANSANNVKPNMLPGYIPFGVSSCIMSLGFIATIFILFI